MSSSTASTLEQLVIRLHHSKLEDLRSLLLELPFSSKFFFNGTYISFIDGILAFFRLEKAYYALRFLSSKSIFHQRENHYASYESLQSGFERIPHSTSLSNPCLEYQTAVVLRTICSLRKFLIKFYCSIDKQPWKLHANTYNLEEEISHLLAESLLTSETMNHPFGTLLDSARSEIKLLLHLLRAQAAISNLRYLDSSLLLARASSFLRLLTKTHGAKAQSTTKPGTLISWYNYFHATLLAKFTLYWFSVLRQASGRDAELLEVAGTEDPCLMMRLIQFKDSTNALSVSLFSDTAPYGQGHGYVLPRTSGSTLTGGESSPFLFTIPQESALSATDVHIIQTLINDSVNVSERDGWNLLLHSFEEKVNRTYVVQKLETSVFLAIVYNGYRARKDRRILTFLQSLSHVVQLQSVATFLRPH